MSAIAIHVRYIRDVVWVLVVGSVCLALVAIACILMVPVLALLWASNWLMTGLL